MQNSQKPKELKILSFDGGGIKGIIPLIIIKNIIKEYPNFLDGVNSLAGTSTGGLIAVMLSYGVPIEKIISLYVDTGKDIFDDNIFDDMKDMFGLTGAKYNQNNLEKLCKNILGDSNLSQVDKKLLITSFCLDNEKDSDERSWQPRIFDNFDNKYLNEKLYELCLRTSAAPCYFPSRDQYYDGGVCANSPAMCILAEAYKAGYNDDNIKLISFGNSKFNKYIKERNADWGVAEVLPNIIDMLMEGNSQLVHYQCKQMINSNYLRINPITKIEFGLDDYRKIRDMIDFAENVKIKGEISDFLEQIWFN